MKRAGLLIAILACGLALPAGASAKKADPRPGGHIYLSLEHAIRAGHLRLALTHRAVSVLGTTAPWVPGQKVTVRISLGSRVIRVKNLSVSPSKTKRAGHFSFQVSSATSGRLGVRVIHGTNHVQRRFEAAPVQILVYRGSLSYGARGPFVGVIQHDLQRVGYPATSSQVFDGRTGRAVLSYRKVNGLGRTSSADRATINKILSGRGGYPVRYPSHGRHVEADLSRQVLAEIDGNRVHAVYDVSSGKPSTPTVLGSFRFYRKQPGTNSHGMVFSTYFIGGYAIHGYKSVPNYPASHGCLRIPIPDAVSVYRWTHIGDRIDVYP